MVYKDIVIHYFRRVMNECIIYSYCQKLPKSLTKQLLALRMGLTSSKVGICI